MTYRKKYLVFTIIFCSALMLTFKAATNPKDDIIAIVENIPITEKSLQDCAQRMWGSTSCMGPVGEFNHVSMSLDEEVDFAVVKAFLARQGIPVTEQAIIKKAIEDLEKVIQQSKMPTRELAEKKRILTEGIHQEFQKPGSNKIMEIFLKWYFEKKPVVSDYSENNLANFNTRRDFSVIKIFKGTPEQQRASVFLKKRRALALEALTLAKKGMSFKKIAEYLSKHGLNKEEIWCAGPNHIVREYGLDIAEKNLDVLGTLKPKQCSPIIETPGIYEIYRLEALCPKRDRAVTRKNAKDYDEGYRKQYLLRRLCQDALRSGIRNKIQWHSTVYRMMYEITHESRKLWPFYDGKISAQRQLLCRKFLTYLNDLDKAHQDEKMGLYMNSLGRYKLLSYLWEHLGPNQHKQISKQWLDSLQEMLKLHDEWYDVRFELAKYYVAVKNNQAAQELLRCISTYAKQPPEFRSSGFLSEVPELVQEIRKKGLITSVQDTKIEKLLMTLK